MSYQDFHIDRKLFKELHQINSLATIFQGLAIISIYILLSFIGVIFNYWWLWIIIWLVQGLFLTGFLGCVHDCAHDTFVKSKKWNRLIGVFWGSIILMNFSLYKSYHLSHHRFTRVEGDTEPSIQFKSIKDYLFTLPMWKFVAFFLQWSLEAYFDKFPHFIKTELRRKEIKQDNKGWIVWICIITLLTIIYPVKTLFFYWIPMLLYPPMLFFASLPEHYGCEEGHNGLTNTRTIKANIFIRFIYFNGNYHGEHHLFPSIPGAKLAKVHQLIGNNFAYQTNSYILFHLQILWGLLKNSFSMTNHSWLCIRNKNSI